ncbi:F-box protein At4g22280-like [Silene latifolia]|uniref:F-box protein At4g22280-like n=1 Tax=Silene latifolia TaxID=37657 RepID=UPI003D775D39
MGVSIAVQKGVQELRYKLNKLHDELLDELVVCETLVRLELMGGYYRYSHIKIPLSASLPCLKILYLHNVTFFDQFLMQRLFSSSKMLEELTVYSCLSHTSGHGIISTRQLKVLRIKNCNFKDGFFEIDAPNLAYLIYSRNVGVKIFPSWKHSCSLVKAELNFSWNPYSVDSYSIESDGEMLKTAAYKTRELYLFSGSVEVLLKLAYQEQMPMFHSLSKLHLCYIYSNSWKYVTSLLDKSPQLETIILEEGLLHCSHYLALPPSEPFSCHAQVIEVRKFCGSNVM